MAALTPEQAVRVKLLADATFAALTTSVHPRAEVPQGTDFPFTAYTRVTTGRSPHLLDASGYVEARVQIDHYSTSFDEARSMGEASRNELDGFMGTVTSGLNSLAIGFIHLQDEGDNSEQQDTGNEQSISWVRQDYLIGYTEALPT